ncbi:MAG: PHP domain-containing protein [Gemmatimonadota bacterium]|nr:MAG: PHP domain-containing protein [Gemmatimonadota bacterium]
MQTNRNVRLHRLGSACGLGLTLLLALGWASDMEAQAYRFEATSTAGMHWFKGNTHTHTLNSDGDSPPEYVARWYKEHGYDFLVLSDHNVLTDPGALGHLVDSTFIMIPGEEVTSSFQQRPVHVNGLNLSSAVEPQVGLTLVATIQQNVDAVRAVDGVPHINHPNYRWALGAEALAQVERYRLLEIFNGHPEVNNQGGGDSPGMEEVWDILLTSGMRVFAIAVDDAHHFQGEFGPDRVNPGRGWVVVKTRALDAGEIMRSLESGLFYASTGVELEDIVVTATALEVRIKQRGDFRYTTTFIGAGGRILKRSGAIQAVYELDGPVQYVRARVTDSRGAVAWTQPVFVISKAAQ